MSWFFAGISVVAALVSVVNVLLLVITGGGLLDWLDGLLLAERPEFARPIDGICYVAIIPHENARTANEATSDNARASRERDSAAVPECFPQSHRSGSLADDTVSAASSKSGGLK